MDKEKKKDDNYNNKTDKKIDKKKSIEKEPNNEKHLKEDIKEEKSKEKKEAKNTDETKNKLIENEDISTNEKKMQKINEEIKANKRKNRNNILKSQKYIKILRNAIIAIVGIAYIEIMILGMKRIPAHEFETDLKVFITLSMALGIIMFEKAYKADKFRIALHGIEAVSMGGATVILLDLFKKQSPNMINFFIGVLIAWTIYFVIKCIVIGIKKNEENNTN